MHRLLERQLKKCFGTTEGFATDLQRFLTLVDEAYRQEDSFRELNQRSMELSSEEMLERNRKLAESQEALRHSEERYRNFVETSQDLIWAVDAEGRITFINQAARSIYGREPAQMIGMRFRDLMPPEQYEQDAALFADMMCAGSAAANYTTQVYDGGGRIVILNVHARVLRNAAGGIVGAAGTSHDITDRRRAELERERAVEHLQSLSRRLVEVQDVEQQRLSHELHDRIGQQLTALGINLKLISDGIPKGSAPKLTSRLHDSRELVEGTTASVRNLITELRPAVLDEHGLLAGLCWYGELFQARTGIVTVVAGEDPAPRLNSNVEVTLLRIVQEALANAHKHAHTQRVSVTLEADSARTQVTVADLGVGFRRVVPEHRSTHRGWGLIVMTERAEAVGGRLHVDSTPGQGTRVVVEVPRST